MSTYFNFALHKEYLKFFVLQSKKEIIEIKFKHIDRAYTALKNFEKHDHSNIFNTYVNIALIYAKYKDPKAEFIVNQILSNPNFL